MTKQEYERRLRNKRRKDGLCTKCGLPLDDDEHITCSKCRARGRGYKKALFEYRKTNHLCTRCGVQLSEDAFRTRCEPCCRWAHERYVKEKNK